MKITILKGQEAEDWKAEYFFRAQWMVNHIIGSLIHRTDGISVSDIEYFKPNDSKTTHN